MAAFTGFPRETLTFLAGLKENNNKEWFAEHRADYDASVEAAKTFVETVGPQLQTFAPDVRYEPKIGASLQRPNRDTRFSKDKRLYKEQIDLWFWHGDKKSFELPGYFLRIEPEVTYVATGMMHILPPALFRYREAVDNERSGVALVETVNRINAIGRYQVGYPSRKSVPKAYATDHPRAEYLLYESLWGHLRIPSEAILEPAFADVTVAAWRDLAPLTEWLMAEIAAPRA
jgi:uncharacterized protein (TIGR02453 family)